MDIEIINKIKTYLEYYSLEYPTIAILPDLSDFTKKRLWTSRV